MEHISNLLPQLLNLAPATNEQKPSENGEIEKFKSALQSQRIRGATVEELKEVIRLIMLKVGIRGKNLPNELEKAVLIGHIISNYAGHTIQEINLAFEMALVGQLECEINCYENFSCAYFSQVMNAYRKWSTQAFRELKTESPIKQETLTGQQIDDLYRKDIEIAYQQMRNGRMPYCLPDYFKEILVKDKLMTEDESLNNFFIQRLGKGFENIYLPVIDTIKTRQ